MTPRHYAFRVTVAPSYRLLKSGDVTVHRRALVVVATTAERAMEHALVTYRNSLPAIIERQIGRVWAVETLEEVHAVRIETP